MDALEKYRLEKQHLNEQLKTFGQDLFKPFFQKLFLDHPEAERVHWVQYTPHFNDGDPCVFGVHDPSVTRHAGAEYDGHEEEDTQWVESWEVKEAPQLAACAHRVGEFFVGIEDAMETAFGDGVEVYVDRSGEVTVNDYTHD